MSGLTQAVALSLAGLALQASGVYVVFGPGVALLVVGAEVTAAGVAAVVANVRGANVR